MTMDIEVRNAVPGDGAILAESTRALAMHQGLGDSFKAVAEDYETALFRDDPVIGALIALDHGVPAGTVVWHRSFSTNAGREVMYLEDISVLPAFRRRGVGKALMQAIARVAVARGYDAMFWMVATWNDGAKKLYAECGAELESEHNICRVSGAALRALAQ